MKAVGKCSSHRAEERNRLLQSTAKKIPFMPSQPQAADVDGYSEAVAMPGVGRDAATLRPPCRRVGLLALRDTVLAARKEGTGGTVR